MIYNFHKLCEDCLTRPKTTRHVNKFKIDRGPYILICKVLHHKNVLLCTISLMIRQVFLLETKAGIRHTMQGLTTGLKLRD